MCLYYKQKGVRTSYNSVHNQTFCLNEFTVIYMITISHYHNPASQLVLIKWTTDETTLSAKNDFSLEYRWLSEFLDCIQICRWTSWSRSDLNSCCSASLIVMAVDTVPLFTSVVKTKCGILSKYNQSAKNKI